MPLSTPIPLLVSVDATSPHVWRWLFEYPLAQPVSYSLLMPTAMIDGMEPLQAAQVVADLFRSQAPPALKYLGGTIVWHAVYQHLLQRQAQKQE